MLLRFAFNKSLRIRKRFEFIELSTNATKHQTANFLILYCRPVVSFSRLGITVSKKVGNAVSRNRIKRLVREFFRSHNEKFPVFDYNIIARSGAANLSYASVCQELGNAFNRIGQRISH